MPRRFSRFSIFVALAILAAGGIGCAVPQPLGAGKEMQVKEERLGAYYYLYLPEDYIKNNGVYPGNPNKRWPVVVTFHGMKPYDTWDRQIHEWEHEADTYGYIVCAPYLYSCDGIFMEFPLTKEHSYVLKDKENVIACLDHVLATTRADPNAVLSTGWSSGGFFAHYIPNRFPNRFSCIATRLCNFSPDIMTEPTASSYRNMPVAIYMGDSDFNACSTQSQEAVAWYKARGFRNIDAKVIDGMGHRRIPQTAAAFFARQVGIEPLRPESAAATLAKLRMTDWTPDEALVSRMSPAAPLVGATLASSGNTGVPSNAPVIRPNPTQAVAANRRTQPVPVVAAPAKSFDASLALADTSGRIPPSGSPLRQPVRTPPAPAPQRPVDVVVSRGPNTPSPAKARPTALLSDTAFNRPRTTGPQDYPVDRLNRSTILTATPTRPPAPTPVAERRSSHAVNIRINGPMSGPGPLYVAYSTDLSSGLLPGADFLWTHNGNPVCDTSRGVRIFDVPGTHRLAVLIITRDGQEYRGSTTITVRDRGGAASSVRASAGPGSRNLYP